MSSRRAFLIVLDSVGCGAMPDAERYGDAGANTLAHVAEVAGGLRLPNLSRMGLGCACEVTGVTCDPAPVGLYGRMSELSVGKDTTTGHWELMGLPILEPFPTYPKGFPADLMERFTELTGYGWLGNVPASGTAIIEELGDEHLRTGKLIVYTSADSVFQIAAHEERVPVEELYRVCALVREQLLVGEHAVARVIARPFIGTAREGFSRTSRRHDYSVAPGSPTALDLLRRSGVPTYGVGKIADIFAGSGITRSTTTASNDDGMDTVMELAHSVESGLIFANLVDFDMVWGHRRDALGYARGLERADERIGELMSVLRGDDLLIVTADHGCDPTCTGSDHTREYVPILATTGRMLRGACCGRPIGTRTTFADVGASLLEWFIGELPGGGARTPGDPEYGASFLGSAVAGHPVEVQRYTLPPQFERAIELLHAHLAPGEEAFLVGGLLRDSILGSVADAPDLDVAVVGDLSLLLNRMERSGSIRVDSRNETLRTARVVDVQSGLSIDLAETRAESYGANSAYPDRTVPVPLDWDLARRDFTMNALALPLRAIDGHNSFAASDVLDPFGGVSDIRAGVIRVLHDESFEDDPTRIIRGLRFARRLGFTFDPHTEKLAAAAVARGAMDRIVDTQLSRELSLLDSEWKG